MLEYVLKKGVIVSPGKEVHTGDLGVKGDKIVSPGGISASQSCSKISLKGKSFVYPSLINTHDHLQGNYRPPVGPKKGKFYFTWLPWDNDLKGSKLYEERSKLSRENLYALSGYKCLFSGVTTVNDHFPHNINDQLLPTLPVRAIQEYCLAHECTSYDLKWGDGVDPEHDRAIKNNWPFITHLAEGFDTEAMRSIDTLEKMKILDDHCLFIHCIGFSDEDIKKVAKAGASVSWCGCSNMFMFNTTAKIRKMINEGVNVTIGTDSSATGSANMLAEIKYSRELYRRLYGEDLSPKKIFEMVTINAAKAFWMQDKTGTLDEGKLGDILVLKAKNDDPYENLVNASMKDIELLVLAGTPIYGELRFLDIFNGQNGELPEGYTKIKTGKKEMFVKGDPAALYNEVRSKVGFKKKLDYLPFEPASLQSNGEG